MGFLVLPSELTGSNYYKWILSSNDKITLQTLQRKVLIKSKYYDNGLLITNIKLRTLSSESGISYSTLKDSINKLDYLGVVLKLQKRAKNNRYFLGFRLSDGNKSYLIQHLIDTYKNLLDSDIENQIEDFKNEKQTPDIRKTSAYRLDKDYRNFIIDHCDKPNILLNKRVLNSKTIFELLFNHKDVYRKALSKEAVLKL